MGDDACVEFAIFCMHNFPPSSGLHAETWESEMTKLCHVYNKLFGKHISTKSIVKVMFRGAVFELQESPGVYVHSFGSGIPSVGLAVLNSLNLHTYIKEIAPGECHLVWDM